MPGTVWRALAPCMISSEPHNNVFHTASCNSSDDIEVSLVDLKIAIFKMKQNRIKQDRIENE